MVFRSKLLSSRRVASVYRPDPGDYPSIGNDEGDNRADIDYYNRRQDRAETPIVSLIFTDRKNIIHGLLMTAPGPTPSSTKAPADKSMRRRVAGERQSNSIPSPSGRHLREVQLPERKQPQNKLRRPNLKGSATD